MVLVCSQLRYGMCLFPVFAYVSRADISLKAVTKLLKYSLLHFSVVSYAFA